MKISMQTKYKSFSPFIFTNVYDKTKRLKIKPIENIQTRFKIIFDSCPTLPVYTIITILIIPNTFKTILYFCNYSTPTKQQVLYKQKITQKT